MQKLNEFRFYARRSPEGPDQAVHDLRPYQAAWAPVNRAAQVFNRLLVQAEEAAQRGEVQTAALFLSCAADTLAKVAAALDAMLDRHPELAVPANSYTVPDYPGTLLTFWVEP